MILLDKDLIRLHNAFLATPLDIEKLPPLLPEKYGERIAEHLQVPFETIMYKDDFSTIPTEWFENTGNLQPLRCNASLESASSSCLGLPSPSEEQPLRSVELFAGAGGLLLGLQQAGFELASAVELEEDAINSLQLNLSSADKDKVYHGDILEWLESEDFHRLKKQPIAVISGGFPCQPFSTAGKGQGIEDTRGTLFYPFAKAVEQLQPTTFVAENVEGLLFQQNGQAMNTILQTFNEAGYVLTYRVLNAMNYGVPQHRKRLFIVGVRKDFWYRPFEFPKEYPFIPLLNSVLRDVPSSEGTTYTQKKYEVMKLVPAGGNWRSLPVPVQKEYMKKMYYATGGRTGVARRLSFFEPSPTLVTLPNFTQTERCHPVETRPLNVREYARIQTFPDSWQFHGAVYSQYKQIGNAVPVNLAKEIGKAIRRYITQHPLQEN